MKNVSFDEMSSILYQEAWGQKILIITDMNQFTFKTFGILEKVDTYTDRTKLTIDNTSSIDINEDKVNSIQFVDELSRNNTKVIEIVLTDMQLITIEFESK